MTADDTPDSPAFEVPDGVVEVDARGLNCPMPVIELAKAIRELEVGTTVHLLATDSTSRVDVPVWCRMQRQRLVHAGERKEPSGQVEYDYLVEKTVSTHSAH